MTLGNDLDQALVDLSSRLTTMVLQFQAQTTEMQGMLAAMEAIHERLVTVETRLTELTPEPTPDPDPEPVPDPDPDPIPDPDPDPDPIPPPANIFTPVIWPPSSGVAYQETIGAGGTFATAEEAARNHTSGKLGIVSPIPPPTLAMFDRPVEIVGAGGWIESGVHATAMDWLPVTLTEPRLHGQRTVWMWNACPVAEVNQMLVDGQRVVPYWDRFEANTTVSAMGVTGLNLQSPEGWAEVMFNCLTYEYGFISFGNRVFLRLPGDRDPRESDISVHRVKDNIGAWNINAPHSRVTDLTFLGIELHWLWNADDCQTDHVRTVAAQISGEAKTNPFKYPTRHLIEYCAMLDHGIWKPDRSGIPWTGIKQKLIMKDGTQVNFNRTFGLSERSAVGGTGFFLNLEARYNLIDGPFNGFHGFVRDFDALAKSGAHYHHNVLRHIGDDAIELDHGAAGALVEHNAFEDCSIVVSVGPLAHGTAVVRYNTARNIGNHGLALVNDLPGAATGGIKYEAGSEDDATLLWDHNTMHSRLQTPPFNVRGGGPWASGGASAGHSLHLQVFNSIFDMSGTAFVAPDRAKTYAGTWVSDYNQFHTDDAQEGIKWNGKEYHDFALYQSESGQDGHSNPVDLHAPLGLTDVLELPLDSPLRHAASDGTHIGAWQG